MSNLQLESTTSETLLSLIHNLADLPCSVIQQTLNRYIQSKTGAKISFLAPILPKTEEMVIHVIGENVLDRGLRFPINQSEDYNEVLNRVIRLRKSLEINSRQLNEELQQQIHAIMNFIPEKVLSIPIEHPIDRHIALVVCLVNYPNKENAEAFCTKVVQECFRYCLGLVLTTLQCQEETRLKLQCQDLLTVSRKLFTHLGDLPDLLREIMVEARKLTNAERCSLFLLDHEHHELVAKVFDGITTTDEMRVALGQGIAGHVATSGNLLNIRNAYEHPLFYSGIDEVTGFRTRNILCFPIRDETQIIGVAQLCNKINGLYFDVCDEEVATAFSIYCGISIMHSIIYKKIQDSQARSKLSNELMMYHMKVEEEAVQALLNCRDDHCPKDFDKFHFSPRNIPHQHTTCYILKMFDELDLISVWRIKRTTLARFILYVKKGYRDAPYHNWIHAFSVAHFAYLMIKNLDLVANNYMTKLQSLVFLVSCLCHDIDHRGTNNSFQTQCGTVLASLYSSEGSVMERHHLAQSMCILNTEGCNIFENLTSDEYSEALDLLRNNILATDLASHFRTIDEQEAMLKVGYKKDDTTQQKLLHAMFMTCCDLSDQTKDWRTSKKTAEQIYDEFFSQGDLEKSMGTAPIEMMDRERASIPNLQVQFITNLVLPLFQNLAKLFSPAKSLVDAIEKNRDIWKIAIPIFHKYSEVGIKGMDVLLDSSIEQEILIAYELRIAATDITSMTPNIPAQLEKKRHAMYFKRILQIMPSRTAKHDSTRMMVAFFAISGLDILNAMDYINETERLAAIEWIYKLQIISEEGGSGFQASTMIPNDARDYQCSHLSMTYTALITLLALGDDLSRVDRKSIVRDMRAYQNPDGCYMAIKTGSESDLRFLYCACCVCAILDDWSGMNKTTAIDYILKSISYDGAMGQGPGLESHGGSTFCAVASLFLMNELHSVLSKNQLEKLKRWCLMRQNDGFQGRPDKPSDTCYSFWVGATLQILDAFNLIDFTENRKFILSTQDSNIGGFSKYYDTHVDPIHTYLGLCGLSLLGEPGLQSMNAALNVSTRVYMRLREIHKKWQND